MHRIEISTKEVLRAFLAEFSPMNNLPSLRDSIIIVSNIELLDNFKELTDIEIFVVGYAVGNILQMPSVMSIPKEKLRNIIRFLWSGLCADNLESEETHDDF